MSKPGGSGCEMNHQLLHHCIYQGQVAETQPISGREEAFPNADVVGGLATQKLPAGPAIVVDQSEDDGGPPQALEHVLARQHGGLDEFVGLVLRREYHAISFGLLEELRSGQAPHHMATKKMGLAVSQLIQHVVQGSLDRLQILPGQADDEVDLGVQPVLLDQVEGPFEFFQPDATLQSLKDFEIDGLDPDPQGDFVDRVEGVVLGEQGGQFFINKAGYEFEHQPGLELAIDETAHDRFRVDQIRAEIGVDEPDLPHALPDHESHLVERALHRRVGDPVHVLVVDAVGAPEVAPALGLEVGFDISPQQDLIIDHAAEVGRGHRCQAGEGAPALVDREGPLRA